MSTLARWCYQHRVVVVLLWLGLLGGLVAASQSAGSAYNNSFSLPNSESNKALNLLRSSFPAQAGDTDTVVWHVDSGSVRDSATRERMTDTLDKIAKLPEISGVTSPYSAQGSAQISKDGRTAYAQVNFAKVQQDLDDADVQRVIDTADAARTDGLQVELGGQAIKSTEQAPPATSELIGVLAAAVVLFIAFGSLFAMLLPILTATAGVGTAILATGLLSHGMTIGEIAPTLSTLIGLGVGIDYALFIVTRHRKGLQSGLDVQESLVRAVNTSGRAVLFAGGTVCIALLGMFVLQTEFLNGVAVASALTVALTVLAAVTLLPALLGLLGMRVLGRRARRRLAAGEPMPENATSGPWVRWAAVVERRPRVLSLVALVVMVALTLPVFSLRLGSSDAGNNPASTTTRKAYDLLADGFGPGFNGPLQLVAQVPSAADKAALTKLSARLENVEGVASVTAMPIRPGSTVGIVQVFPTASPQDKETSDLIDRLRDEVIPTAEKGTALKVYVGGPTAMFNDFATVLTGKLPLFIVVIVILGGLLLMLAFRSLLIPVVAGVMNLLAAGASFGILIAVFQWGWGSEALGLGRAGPIEAFLPVMMISILFGLSMDYQVFLVSRMHEEWVHTKDNARSVRVGQVETARVITAASAIMVCVFIAFVFGGQRTIAEFGIGLSAAVALDAFVLRTILVPASMHLFGKANWWLPAWLDRRMPHLSVDPPDEPFPASAQDSPAPEPEPSARS
ncbi:MMPL family transporter [Streptomyces sp. NBC_00452]|uniref:MMPL family transporter n=1 Tax=Streptomyces sp. NBC_00452 TaxID=2975746 RepID=UPI0022509806|nr:MMPL family transporter [Streptomyces sp. NBC_00452]MCX5059089.1 MMPL family transporter [Streptomyces sp. NBC_00452]